VRGYSKMAKRNILSQQKKAEGVAADHADRDNSHAALVNYCPISFNPAEFFFRRSNVEAQKFSFDFRRF
jgi:hypothetical protein